MPMTKEPLTPGRKLAAQAVIVVGIGALILLGFAWWATTQADAANDRASYCRTQTSESFVDCYRDR